MQANCSDKFNVDVGIRLRDLRVKHGYTREMMCELAGINDKYLYEIEVGKKGLSAKKLYALSRALCATMDYIASGESDF
ncbi:MAG: helix-turn-helix domain-containing protein [Tannerellaceae bacterium]|jgi:transcriptional regulator with XRE-family HTH domain|nr:helix-turn-helix domain-containing protein [Tannerellaceae bacterium]